ncbi:carboxy-terminal domain RNA polymerase II polypeptide A small phosphatase 1-like [Salvia splendens]|uniref:carboxy-terminal domain RNA polymerase II polypeptide A small phosphatase 1-like n=1 Tax=Salvia splendens TaxID=180675 RepID=UPI001C25F084|nr:carboxy-terminal domain RNA polymerase II polypeptide A small phosphatase 1-like [Salvia splendens]XP_042041790.1 carboxy-terminal domain RNA polymerase II polypeptide A small phosphatase 1-like [Salvia splendens]
MVSKVVKRTPTKSLKNRKNFPFTHRRTRNKSPIKTTAAATVASINKSIYTCHRRLLKIFTKLTRIATPEKTPRKKGYKILQKSPPKIPPSAADVRRSLFTNKLPLPPPTDPQKHTIFLDLDETLIHSTAAAPPERYDFVVRPVIDGQKTEFYVLKRPFVDEFLAYLSDRFEIVIFTAGIEEYASLVVDKLNWRNGISHRLYRDSCRAVDGMFVKDLGETGRDLSRAVIVDDNPNSYQFQPENAIPIKQFVDDVGDEELKKMMELFEGCDLGEDLRDFVRVFVGADEKLC